MSHILPLITPMMLIYLHELYADPVKLITDIASVQGVILSSQLKDMLMNANSLEVSEGMYRPLKLTYHPREPFFVIKEVFYSFICLYFVILLFLKK